jgi:mycothiol synthase
MSFTHRPYAGEADYRQMRSLLVHAFALGGPANYCSVGELDWWRWGPTGGTFNIMNFAELWWDERDTLVGVVWRGTPWGTEMQLDLLPHPQHPEVIEAMLDWAEAEQRAAAGSTLATWAFTGDQPRVRALQARGYQPVDLAFSFLSQSLAADFPVLPLPAGYTLRHVQGEADYPARVEVHRDAFAPSRLTVDIYRKLAAEAPTYRPALDLVVVAPDTSFASYCLVWFDETNRIGVFEPVGCHSAHRQKGLTKAVMLEGLRRLQALGAEQAIVNTRRGAVAANALYASAGFQQVDDNESWQKTL